MQLVAYGAQDVYLTGNPQITFFKVNYRRHTNFAMESIENPFNGAPNFSKKVTCTIQRNGDLIYRMYLQATLPKVSVTGSETFRWLNWVGHNLIKSVELEIGGQRIDKHYGDWLHIWNELTQQPGKQAGYAKMVGNVPALCNAITSGQTGCPADCGEYEWNTPAQAENYSCIPEYTLYIPLQFWFCRNPGLALPLIALQYHEVRINLEFNDLKNLCWGTETTRNDVASKGLVAASLYVDYIYLDVEERRKFAQVSHEYLIDVLQFTGAESITASSNKIKLNFNHPVKELIWVVQRDSFVVCSTTDADITAKKGQQPFNYTDEWDDVIGTADDYLTAGAKYENYAGRNPVVAALLQLNGHDRFQMREGRYFNEVQPYQHHTNIPAVGINVYSFALNPEQHQPSGTCNLSRIDTANLQITVSNNTVSQSRSAQVRVYAVSYNVLRVMSGMGGLAYSN